MKSDNLLSHLYRMESLLNEYSYEELRLSEASELKRSFQRFKLDFEGKYLGEDRNDTITGLNFTTTSSNVMIKRDIEEIDLSSLFSDCLGDRELLREAIDQHKNHVLGFIGEAKGLITCGFMAELSLALHNVRISLEVLRSKKLLQLVQEMKGCCSKGGHLQQLKSLYLHFLEEYPKAEKGIERALARL